MVARANPVIINPSSILAFGVVVFMALVVKGVPTPAMMLSAYALPEAALNIIALEDA
jgi:hypothetical protein